jgi:signal transduction histidine kinase/tetratricopeptide (TPR) repeat protein
MRLPLLLLAVLSVIGSQLAAQSFDDKKVLNELNAHPQHDTFHVNRLIDLSYSGDYNFDEREKFADEALSISLAIQYYHGKGIALANSGYLKIRQGNMARGDSMLQAADALGLAINDPEVIGLVAFRKAVLQRFNGDPQGSLPLFQKAEKFMEQVDNKAVLIGCWTAMAEMYQITLGNYPLAMEYNLKLLDLAEKLNLKRTAGETLVRLAAVHTAIGDHISALKVLERATEEIKKIDNNEGLISNLNNSLGEEYRVTGRYKEAIEAYNKSIKISPNGNDYVNESNLADVYTRIDSLPLAFYYAFKSLKEGKEQGDPILITWVHGILARAYLKKGMPDSSIYYAKSGLDSAIRLGAVEFMRDNTVALAEAYAYKKDFNNAYNHYRKYIVYRDSLVSGEVRNKTAMLQYNNEMEKKQSQISQLNEQKKSQQKFLTGALIALTLILVLAVLVLRNNRQKRKANALLQKQKTEIEQSYNNMQLLGEIGHQVSSSLSVERIISTVYNNVNTLMDANVFGIGIYNEKSQRIEFPATYEDGKPLPFYINELSDKNRFAPVCFNNGKEIIIGDLHKEYSAYIQQVSTPQEGEQPLSLIFLPLMVKDKKLGVITVQSFKLNAYTDYHLFMLRNIAVYAAIAIDNAESYEELSNALGDLKKAQGQLIQSEKMASLGELTAGIAHEIQNPLNFVNNFSEVNTELIDELTTELQEGNIAEARAIAGNIRENERKIMQHGKRADVIVKGMLQHSRSETGVKQATDINSLCDEYLKLSYHGLRARDNTFNAVMETHFDEKLKPAAIIPQDIGRVLLNVYNNAFYAVNEKKKTAANGFEPVVSVRTEMNGSHVRIYIKDNGTGMPQKVADKIFQPFFTTKPTGQGTGLGLSLSYDIVKAHEGEITLETKEGEGSLFVISLPV